MLRKRETTFKKNRKGKVLRLVREKYLRDDIMYGVVLNHEKDEIKPKYLNSIEDLTEILKKDEPIYILDIEVLKTSLDLLKITSNQTFLKNIVICESLLNSIRHSNLSLFNRILLFVKKEDKERTIIIFPDRYHLNASTPSKVHEYYLQIPQFKTEFLTLSVLHQLVHKNKKHSDLIDMLPNLDSKDEPRKEREAIFEEHKPKEELLNLLKDKNKFIKGKFRSVAFNKNKGSVLVENLKIEINNFKDINRAIDGDTVVVEILNLSESMKVEQASSSLDPKTLEKEEKEKEENEDLLQNLEDLVPNFFSKEDIEKKMTEIKQGKIIGVLKRNWFVKDGYYGSIDEKDIPENKIITSKLERVLFIPVNPNIPKISIQTKQLENIYDKRILVNIDKWDRFSLHPSGHLIKILGKIGDKQVETQVILHEHDIPTKEFSRKVLECLPKEGKEWKVEDELKPFSSQENVRISRNYSTYLKKNLVLLDKYGPRVDLRKEISVCSIDPPDCQDIDDALHCRVLEEGKEKGKKMIELGVHIADVSYFVRQESSIDNEAKNRGTSTYLVDRRLDMLPKLLTTDICSLRDKVHRFAFSVIWTLEVNSTDDKSINKDFIKEFGFDFDDFKVIDIKYHKSVIASKGAMTYQQAQDLLDKKLNARYSKELGPSVRLLLKISKILKSKRMNKGALVLASPEVRFKLDESQQDPTDVQLYSHFESNSLVEEMMLFANITVARHVTDTFPNFSLLRRHPKPLEAQFVELKEMCKIKGFKMNTSSNKELGDSLNKIDKKINTLIRILATRCMQQAKYFCSSDFAYSEYEHYGLATEIYTHFTSPIRRYADLVVHRLLTLCDTALIHSDVDKWSRNLEMKEIEIMNTDDEDRMKIPSSDEIREVSLNINKRHHMAQLAGRASVALYTILYFKDKTRVSKAKICKIQSESIVVVFIPEFGIEGKIDLKASLNLSDKERREFDLEKKFEYERKIMTLRYKKNGKKLKIFDEVTVKIEVITRPGRRQKLVISLVKPSLV